MVFKRAIVTAVAPLRILIDGDTVAVPFTPESLIDPAALAVDDVVRAELSGNRLVVLGRSGGLGLVSGRNVIINGNFRTNQRAYVSGGVLGVGAYGFDRWKSNTSGGTLTFTAAPQGQIVTLNAGKVLLQSIERINMPAGDYILSWEGTAAARVYNAGDTPPSYAASPVSVSLDGSDLVVVDFTAAGSSKTLSKVQLEPGSIAHPFEQITFGEELARCRRYYYRTAPAVDQQALSNYGVQLDTTRARVLVALPTQMRTTPTLGWGSLFWTDRRIFNSAVSALTLNTPYVAPGSLVVEINPTYAANGAQFRPGVLVANTTAGYLSLDAEL